MIKEEGKKEEFGDFVGDDGERRKRGQKGGSIRLTAVVDDDGRRGVSLWSSDVVDLFEDVETVDQFAKDDVSSIEPSTRRSGDEEL